MPLVSVFIFVLLSSASASAADGAADSGCEPCSIFQRQADSSETRNGAPGAVRPPVFRGGATGIPDASERYFNRGQEQFANSTVQVAPENTSNTVSMKRLSHKPPKAARKAYEKAVRLSEKGQSLESIALLEKAVAIDPEYMEALNNLGARHVVIGDYEGALPYLNKAIALDPHSVQPYCNLSLAYLGSGDAEAAERAARQAIDNDPSESRGRFLLGISLVAQRKQAKEASQNLRRVQDQFPQARFAIAIAETLAGNTAAAKISLKEYLELNHAPKREEAAELLAGLEAQERMAAK